MAFIDVVSPEHATGALAALYQRIAGARGGVATVHQVQSLNPKAMQAHLEMYKAILFQKSTLSRIQRERLGVAVSIANGCAYCSTHHAQALRNLGDDPDEIARLQDGGVPEAEPDRSLVQWAIDRTKLPGEASEEDVRRLKAEGLDDRAILDATLTIGYFNFVNRLVLMLGVHLEDDFAATCGTDLE